MNDEDLRAGQRIHHDESGQEYVLDERGNRIPPMQSQKISKDGEFTEFDSAQGHCGLCGRLTCGGSCFK